jgi:hypothetical protein
VLIKKIPKKIMKFQKGTTADEKTLPETF